MARKLCLLMSVAALLAVAAPATASATQFTNAGGGLVAVGTSVSGTNVGTFTLTSSLVGSITCQTVTLKGKVVKNTGSEAEIEGVGQSATSNCLWMGNAVTATDFTLFTIKHGAPAGTFTMSFVVTMDLPKVTCTFTGTNVPYSYTGGGSTITFSNAAGVTSATCGATKLDAVFGLETTAGSSILLD